jgi:hypothetical protein
MADCAPAFGDQAQVRQDGRRLRDGVADPPFLGLSVRSRAVEQDGPIGLT